MVYLYTQHTIEVIFKGFCQKMYDLRKVSSGDMTKCLLSLTQIHNGASSMEETANRIVRYFYDNFIDGETGKSAFALVRFFKTHTYEELEPQLKKIADNSFGKNPKLPSTKCLTLLGTVGDQPNWNSRRDSVGHQVIPLLSKEIVEQHPMISQLIEQLGLEIDILLNRDQVLIRNSQQKQYNIFFVPEALGSKYVNAQQEFVMPYKIRSVLGFGGILPSGHLFTIILFSKIKIAPETANLFNNLTLSIKLAITRFDVGMESVFSS